jgi:hypothetical protein
MGHLVCAAAASSFLEATNYCILSGNPAMPMGVFNWIAITAW